MLMGCLIMLINKIKEYKEYLILVVFTMGTQALFYFLIKSFISEYNIIDSIVNVPLIKEFVYFYCAWYPFIILNTFIIYKCNKKIFYYLIATMLLGALMSQITFLLYPSMIVRPNIEVTGLTSWILDFTYRTDTPAVNCLPSMHCVYCFVTSYYILKCKKLENKYKYLIVTFSMLIVLSTIFIHQHVLEDIILSFIYTTIAVLIIKLCSNKIDKFSNNRIIKSIS